MRTASSAQKVRRLYRRIPAFLEVFKLAFVNLKANDPVRMAGATAFFAFFALPPIVILLSQVLSLLFNDRRQVVSGRLFGQLAELFGPQGARQLHDISQHLRPRTADTLSMVVSVALLLLASTTLFAVIKSSLNQLWNVKARPQRTVLRGFKDRGMALFIILLSGMLFMLSLVLERSFWLLVSAVLPLPWTHNDAAIGLGNDCLSIGMLTVWFALLFQLLPDVRVRRTAVWTGALVTSLLFTLGEAVLSRLLTHSQMRSLYGSAGAIILILLFVFYCSLIFYYGAAFTRQFTHWAHLEAAPTPNAVGYTITETGPPEP